MDRPAAKEGNDAAINKTHDRNVACRRYSPLLGQQRGGPAACWGFAVDNTETSVQRGPDNSHRDADRFYGFSFLQGLAFSPGGSLFRKRDYLGNLFSVSKTTGRGRL